MSAQLAIQLVAAHRGLVDAHRHAERFHYAMGEALETRAEIDSVEPGEDVDPYWVDKYQRMLGIAAAELQAMPAVWAAILTANIGDGK